MAKPESVGDLPAFQITFTPGENDPSAVAADVVLLVHKPDGTETDDSAGLTAAGTNVFNYKATTRIDVAGSWRWRWNSNSGLIDSGELGLTIGHSSFKVPLP